MKKWVPGEKLAIVGELKVLIVIKRRMNSPHSSIVEIGLPC
jgi:hypothetical protein